MQEAGSNNQILINGALNAVNYRLNQLGGSAVEPVYGGRGQERVSHSKNFDFKAWDIIENGAKKRGGNRIVSWYKSDVANKISQQRYLVAESIPDPVITVTPSTMSSVNNDSIYTSFN